MTNFKNIYNFSQQTGEFLGAGNAQEDPKNEGMFLAPPHSTYIEPPIVEDGNALVFADGVWNSIVDFRGQKWFDADGNIVLVSELGDPQELGLLQLKPLPNLAVAKIQAKLLSIDYADELANQFTAKYSQAEQSTFIQRAIEARAVKAGEPVVTHASYLLKLANGNEALVDDMATAILEKAELFENVTVAISQMRDMATIAIDETTTNAELAEVMVMLQTQADAKAAELMALV